MNIPKEFEDVFQGVELTEDEIRTLNWIIGWERRTVENLRSAIQKVQTNALSTLQAENEKLRAEVEQVHEDNKKLCAAMMAVRRKECPEPLRVVYELSYDAILSHEDIRNIARIVFDGLMREDLSLRGQKES